ncbi:hypothetical protein JCM3774_000565 [Rhodotorula dairenensis]
MRQDETSNAAPAAAQTLPASRTDDATDGGWIREGPVRLLQNGCWKRKNGPVACNLPRPAPLVWVHPLDLQIECRPIKQLRSSATDNVALKGKIPASPSPPKPLLPPPPRLYGKKRHPQSSEHPGSEPPKKRARRASPAPDLRRFTPLADPPQAPTKLAILAALGAELLDIETWRRGQRVTPAEIVSRPLPSPLSHPTSSLRCSDDQDLPDSWNIGPGPTKGGAASPESWRSFSDVSSRRMSDSTQSSGTSTVSTVSMGSSRARSPTAFGLCSAASSWGS